jgi:hypothetical protein
MKGERRLRRPPPDLQELVRRYGTYPQVTPQAWAQYDHQMERWKDDLRNGRLDVAEG